MDVYSSLTLYCVIHSNTVLLTLTSIKFILMEQNNQQNNVLLSAIFNGRVLKIIYTDSKRGLPKDMFGLPDAQV